MNWLLVLAGFLFGLALALAIAEEIGLFADPRQEK